VTDPRPDSSLATIPVEHRPQRPADPRGLLRGRPREVLERIARDDALELLPRVEAELARRCLLLDEQGALLRSWARCARHAGRLRRHQGLESWLDRQVSAAIDDLVDEGGAHELGPRWSGLARELGLGERELRTACARFNRLPIGARRTFFWVVLEGRALDSLAYPGGPSVTAFARDARRALLLFLGPSGDDGRGPEVCP
jgi:hypothetical protein